jgi:hypothetical protein
LRFNLAGSTLVVVTTIIGRRPAGTVAFSAGRLRATIPLERGRAVFVLPGPARSLTVRYSGDGNNRPSRQRLKLR